MKTYLEYRTQYWKNVERWKNARPFSDFSYDKPYCRTMAYRHDFFEHKQACTRCQRLYKLELVGNDPDYTFECVDCEQSMGQKYTAPEGKMYKHIPLEEIGFCWCQLCFHRRKVNCKRSCPCNHGKGEDYMNKHSGVYEKRINNLPFTQVQ